VEQLAARAAQLEAREQALAEDSEAAAAREPTVHPVRVAPVRGIVQGGQEEAAFADRLTVLGEREADLAESISALEQKERELALLREELETERGRLAERWRRLGEAEQVPGRTAVRLVRFSEGLRELARKRGVA
jgi:hypothetical protein